MADKIIYAIMAGVALIFALYFLIGIIIARFIVKPKVRSHESLIRDELNDHKTHIDIINKEHKKVQIIGHNRYRQNARVYISSHDTNKWIIALHGYGNSSVTLAKYAVMFNNLGYNVLAADMRRSGETGGKSITFGYFERRDLEDWIEYLYKQYKNIEIGIFGISLGAATGILTASLRTDIKFVISYCSFSSFKDIVTVRIKALSNFLMLFYPAVLVGGYFWSKARLGTIDITNAVANVDCPILIMHSKEDAFTPYSQAVKLSEASLISQLHLFEKGAHARAFVTSPEEYKSVITGFLNAINK